LLIGGWQLAAARQSGGFDPVRETISALASRGATDAWVMTAALAAVGVCHTVTAAGLAPAAVAGRALWPALAWRRGGRPRPGVWWLAATGLLGLLGWFAIEYISGSSRIGLAERVLTAAQALWPFAAVLTARRSSRLLLTKTDR
jgi:hypothetical protein